MTVYTYDEQEHNSIKKFKIYSTSFDLLNSENEHESSTANVCPIYNRKCGILHFIQTQYIYIYIYIYIHIISIRYIQCAA